LFFLLFQIKQVFTDDTALFVLNGTAYLYSGHVIPSSISNQSKIIQV